MAKKPSLFTLFLLIGFGTVAAVLYTPALPAIMHDFDITRGQVQLTVTIFMAGYAIGQWLFGPITQRFGRKPALYLGIVIGIIGAIICIVSAHMHSFIAFLIGRVIQALGTSVGLVGSLAIIHDVHAGMKARKVIAYAMLAFAILPGIAITIGGFLVHHFNWVSCFYFLVIYSFLVLFLSWLLPETCKACDTQAAFLTRMLKLQKKLLSPQLILYACLWGLCTGAIYVFAATAPLFVIHSLKIPPREFGVINFTIFIALALGNVLAARLADRCEERQLIFWGIFLFVLSVLALWIFTVFHWLTIWSFYIIIFINYLSMPPIFTNAASLSTQNAIDKTGASSLVSTINLLIGTLSVLFVQLLHFKLDYLIPTTFLVITVAFILAFCFTQEKYIQKKEKSNDF